MGPWKGTHDCFPTFDQSITKYLLMMCVIIVDVTVEDHSKCFMHQDLGGRKNTDSFLSWNFVASELNLAY